MSSTTWTTAKVRTCDKGKCDVEICYNSIGKETDPCVLLVMGLDCQGIHWDAEFCEAIAAKGFRVIRFDNRSIGYSTKFDHMPVSPLWTAMLPAFVRPAAPYSLLDMADDAAALLDHLSIAAAHWVGRSMGGMIAQEAALRHPKRCRSLTLIMTNSGNQAGVFKPPWWVLLHFLKKPKSNSVDDITDFRVTFSRNVMYHGCPFDDDWVRTRERATVERSTYNGVLKQLAAISSTLPRDDRLHALGSMPVTVVHGVGDVLVPVSNGLHLAALIPGAKLVLLENMGHVMPTWHFDRFVKEIEEVALRAKHGAN